MLKTKPKRSIGTFKSPKNTMEVSPENMKKFTITPAKKMPDFNSRSFRRSERRMEKYLDGYGRRSLRERIFPRRSGFFWKGTHNGVFGPGGSTHWEFKSGNLALVIAVITLILVIVGIWILI